MSYLNQNKTIVVKNIFHMLAYAFDSLNESEYTELGTETFDDVQDLYAEIISAGTARQLKQGLYREYMIANDDILTKRGTLVIPKTIDNRIKNKRQLNCDFDVYTEDNYFNRILKTTILLLIGSDKVDEKRKTRLKSLCKRLANIRAIDPQTITWSSLQFRRNSGVYQMLLTICRLALEDIMMSQEGNKRIKKIEADEKMSKLYERFIFNYYRKHYPKLHVSSSQIPWDMESTNPNMPIMQSDVTIENKEKILIIDAKLYSHTLISKRDYDKKSFISANLYQIFTYVSNKRQATEKQVSGMLLYAMTDEEITPDDSFSISGNDYSVKTLDLNREFRDIASQLDAIINQTFPDAIKATN